MVLTIVVWTARSQGRGGKCERLIITPLGYHGPARSNSTEDDSLLAPVDGDFRADCEGNVDRGQLVEHAPGLTVQLTEIDRQLEPSERRRIDLPLPPPDLSSACLVAAAAEVIERRRP